MSPRQRRARRPTRPSRPVRPILALLDLLGRRWALRILWELRDEALGFTDLQARCDTMSPSVLNQRLRELRAGGILELRDGRYLPTPRGRRLHEPLVALNDWANEWARAPVAAPARRRARPTSRRT